MNENTESKGHQPHPDAAQAEAIAKMCAAHNISLGAVPNNINDVPVAIAAILQQRPMWGMDRSW